MIDDVYDIDLEPVRGLLPDPHPKLSKTLFRELRSGEISRLGEPRSA
jgi:hypothetical protein